MIQRIQTIFLLLAGGSSFGLFGLPFASSAEAVAGSAIFSDGVFNIMDNAGLIGLFAASGVLALISIFVFRNRMLQMRLTIFSFIASLIGIVLGVVYFMQHSNDIGQMEVKDELGLYLPVLTLVFLLVAYRFINKDEKLVRSMDRLR
jgi:hypothetical protein